MPVKSYTFSRGTISKNFSGLLPKNKTVPFFNWPSFVTNFRLVNNCSFEVTLTKPASKRNVLIFSFAMSSSIFASLQMASSK